MFRLILHGTLSAIWIGMSIWAGKDDDKVGMYSCLILSSVWIATL